MAQIPTIQDMAKRVAEEAKKNLEVNDMPLDEFIVKANNCIKHNDKFIEDRFINKF